MMKLQHNVTGDLEVLPNNNFMEYIIVTDSTADLPKDYVAEKNLTVLNLSYTIEDVTYGIDKELDDKIFYDKMRAGQLPTTSQINPEEAREKLSELLEQNKNILYIAFSSGLSGTYNSIRLAAEELNDEIEESNIIVVDSLCASLGEGLFVYKAVENKEKGMSIEDNVKWLEDHKLNFVHKFTVDDLNHLYRGGRVSRSTAFIGTVLNIKPILHVDDEGHLIPIGKERGRKKSLIKLVDLMEESMGKFRDDNDIFFISHGDCLEDALIVKEEINRRFGINKCIINCIGPTIGAHAGPGTVALFFLGESR